MLTLKSSRTLKQDGVVVQFYQAAWDVSIYACIDDFLLTLSELVSWIWVEYFGKFIIAKHLFHYSFECIFGASGLITLSLGFPKLSPQLLFAHSVWINFIESLKGACMDSCQWHRSYRHWWIFYQRYFVLL